MQVLSLPVLAGVFCGAALSGCGSNPAPAPPTALQLAWDNHFSAFGAGVAAQDEADPTEKNTAALDQIMEDYTNESVVRLWDHSAAPGSELSDYTGLAEIRAMFNDLFPALKGCNGNAENQLAAQVAVDEGGQQVFLVWSCASATFYRATDTFIFETDPVGGAAKISNQNIVVAKSAPASQANSLVQFRRLQYNPGSVSDAWTNHADAFMAGAAAGGDPARDAAALEAAVTKIMLDYDATSQVRLYGFGHGLNSVESTTFELNTGMAEIEAMFRGLFESMTNATAPAVPLAEVVDVPKQVFLIWEAPDSKYLEATDTFMFDENFKIRRQNIATFMTNED